MSTRATTLEVTGTGAHTHGSHTHEIHAHGAPPSVPTHSHNNYSRAGHGHRSYARTDHPHPDYAERSDLEGYVPIAERAQHTHSGLGPRWIVPLFHTDAALWVLNPGEEAVLVEVHERGQGQAESDWTGEREECWSDMVEPNRLMRLRRSARYAEVEGEWMCTGTGAISSLEIQTRPDEASPPAQIFVMAVRRLADGFWVLPAIRLE